ncbi:MAG: type II toxin-antitoxin system RelE/ParE family toxin [Candidatus Bathyarchaeota archaeon]|nr:type II toxin-antitoxin system RelE/ParE family toxin [Candidatus Bathyarchaeota archaeon]
MSRFSVVFGRRAERELARREPWVIDRVLELADALVEDATPEEYDVEPMKGAHEFFRARIGDVRVVYRVEEEKALITILRVAPRGRAY